MSFITRTYPLLKKALFCMDAEKAHHFSLKRLKQAQQTPLLKSLTRSQLPDAPINLMGLHLKNPVGLAAGLDKNGKYIDALAHLGFGFIEVGTVTPKPQAGNPQPRLFRLPEAQCIINRMGFNNQGLEQFLSNVKQSKWRQQGGILGLNIGKNANTPIANAIDDYLIGLAGVYPFADYITINISSPNTENLRSLQEGDELANLFKAINIKKEQLTQEHQKKVPIVVKIAPDLDENQINHIAQVVEEFQIDGIIATNTTLTRDAVKDLPNATEAGGLSGPPVHELSLNVIRQLRNQLGPEIALIGVGGISSSNQALEKIEAGANAIQLYTGLIYQGPKLVHDCVKAFSQ